MAALNQEGFTLATDDTIEELQNGAKNINTSKRTSFWLSMWETWCEGMNIASDIEEHEQAELTRLLEKRPRLFMNAALDRHLKDKQYVLSIGKDREFHSFKHVLKGKVKLLRQAGRGNRPNKARNLTKEEEVLWKESKFGSTTP